MSFTRILTALTLAAVFFSAPATPVAKAALLPQCTGCTGSGGSSSSSGGSCGGFVSISVTLSGGKCRAVHFYEPWSVSCAAISACTPTVNRSWSGLPSGSELDFCILVGNEELCLAPKPTVGPSGGGSDSRSSSGISCGSSRSFSIGSSDCGLSASTDASCSACTGL